PPSRCGRSLRLTSPYPSVSRAARRLVQGFREIELSHRRRGRVVERRRAHGHGTRREGRWDGDRVHGGGAGGYSAGSGVLPQRRNSALCAAAVGGVGGGRFT